MQFGRGERLARPGQSRFGAGIVLGSQGVGHAPIVPEPRARLLSLGLDGALWHSMPMRILPVILSGGAGTRLWPLSREAYPKQFLAIDGKYSLLQNTWRRLQGLADLAAPLVVANEQHRFLVAEQLHQVGGAPQAIVLEPCARNTAPAIAAAALVARENGEDPLLLVLPSDHLIRDDAAFRAAVQNACAAADAGHLLTFGIRPKAPETGYGYIQMQAARADGVHAVRRFVEKPDAATAQSYLDSGDYVWNSGLFLFRASCFLDELRVHAPAMLQAVEQAVREARRDADFLRLGADAFAACPADSIDYAVMEKSARILVQPMDVGWNDVGSWSAIWDIADKDAQGNALHGDVQLHEVRRSLIWGEARLVGVLGLDDVVVVDSDDALLVAHRDRVQDLKSLVAGIKTEGRSHARSHRKVYRPWGCYDSIDQGDRFQVKHLTIKPGGVLSMQMHHQRAEHWIVVRGAARVTCDDRVFDLGENQSTFIPLGSKHRLENPSDTPLEIIEVQSGAYLGEDDIVRFEDIYGRSGA